MGSAADSSVCGFQPSLSSFSLSLSAAQVRGKTKSVEEIGKAEISIGMYSQRVKN